MGYQNNDRPRDIIHLLYDAQCDLTVYLQDDIKRECRKQILCRTLHTSKRR